jgi:ADP-ribosylglycohydrolase
MQLRDEERFARARCSLEGLSVGDAFGQGFFVNPAMVESLIAERALPAPPWRYTDDTEMALSLVAVLRVHCTVDQHMLASSFARRYDYHRGYGPAMYGLLENIRAGSPWQHEAGRLFEGQGSWGNGAAMRVAPLGAYFADDPARAAAEAARQAAVTHAHSEAAAGAIAIAVAAAWACRLCGASALPQGPEFLDLVLPHVPDGTVRSRIRRARDLAPEVPVATAVGLLGNGSLVSAQDTVPFVLWCAARFLDDYEEALWLTVSGLGDRDTTCAMVGGIVACCTGAEAIPSPWHTAREPLPRWPFEDGNER